MFGSREIRLFCAVVSSGGAFCTLVLILCCGILWVPFCTVLTSHIPHLTSQLTPLGVFLHILEDELHYYL
jgi:hypothetical protein